MARKRKDDDNGQEAENETETEAEAGTDVATSPRSPKQGTEGHTPGVVDEEDTSADVHRTDLVNINYDESGQGDGELPSQLVPYPTGNPPPNRDYFGRYVDENGKPVNLDGSPIEETP